MYIELYIKRARTLYPDLYMTMQNDTALKELVKTQWLRTHFYLLHADMYPGAGIHDGDIRVKICYDPANMSEISNLIGRCVEPSNCLCD